jgi:hypothetical protein
MCNMQHACVPRLVKLSQYRSFINRRRLASAAVVYSVAPTHSRRVVAANVGRAATTSAVVFSSSNSSSTSDSKVALSLSFAYFMWHQGQVFLTPWRNNKPVFSQHSVTHAKSFILIFTREYHTAHLVQVAQETAPQFCYTATRATRRQGNSPVSLSKRTWVELS